MTALLPSLHPHDCRVMADSANSRSNVPANVGIQQVSTPTRRSRGAPVGSLVTKYGVGA
jgi:hypothetical protein